MSRSIGDDLATSLGVVADAEVLEHEIDETDACVILASDGVWEFITEQEAVDICFKQKVHGDPATPVAVVQGEYGLGHHLTTWARSAAHEFYTYTRPQAVMPGHELPRVAMRNASCHP